MSITQQNTNAMATVGLHCRHIFTERTLQLVIWKWSTDGQLCTEIVLQYGKTIIVQLCCSYQKIDLQRNLSNNCTDDVLMDFCGHLSQESLEFWTIYLWLGFWGWGVWVLGLGFGMDSHRLFFVCVDAHCTLLFLYLTPGVFFRRLAEYHQKRFTTEN